MRFFRFSRLLTMLAIACIAVASELALAAETPKPARVDADKVLEAFAAAVTQNANVTDQQRRDVAERLGSAAKGHKS